MLIKAVLTKAAVWCSQGTLRVMIGIFPLISSLRALLFSHLP